MYYLLLFMLIFITPSCSEVVDPSNVDNPAIIPDWVMGEWKFKDDKGKDATVTLYPDGSAIGSDNSIGSWFYIDGNIHLVWTSGWMNLIRKNYKGYVKLGFAPGVATDDPSTNESEATKVTNAPK